MYIGLSQNVYARKKEHFYLLSKGKHTNYKVQNAYNTYGMPEHVLLELCPIYNLSNREVYWSNEFNALGANGLCLVEPGVVGFGTNANSSKYPRATILKVFALLSSNNQYSYAQIANRTKTNKSLAYEIKSGNTHRWLSAEYPVRYRKMLIREPRKNSILYLRGNSTKIISPDNREYDVVSIKDFVVDIFGTYDKTICTGLGRVLDGTRKTYKGWRLST